MSTFVVSWNDDAEMKLSIDSDAFVMPSSNGSPWRGLAGLLHHALVLLLEQVLLDVRARIGRAGGAVIER